MSAVSKRASPSRPRRSPRSLLVALAAGAAALAAVPAGAQDGPPPTAVRVDAIRREELQDRRRVTGELRAVRRSRVATQEPGIVTALPVEEGQAVQEGDVLATLDARRLEIERDRLVARARSLEALITSWEAQVALEESDVAALDALVAQRASNPKEVADARLEAHVAAARLEAARRDLEAVRAESALVATRIDDMTIESPYDGIVVRTLTERGEWLAEGAGIVDVVSTGSYDAWMHVPQRYARAVGGSGEPMQLRVDATGRTVDGATPTIVPLVDPTARLFDLYVRVEDEEGVLVPGMTVTGWVPTGERRPFLTLPRDAVLRNVAGAFVYVARSGGGPAEAGQAAQATPVPLEVLFEWEGRVAVREGAVREGDLVVVEGNERLFPMMPITPLQRDGGGGPGTGAGPGGGA